MRDLFSIVAVVCASLLASSGCNRTPGGGEPSGAGAVAVIDLDAIAKRLGSDKQIVDAIAQRQTSLGQQLVELAKSYNAQIEERKKTLAEQAAEDGKVTLAAWQQQANANLSKVKQQAELDLQRHRAALVKEFRDQIKPTARRVAQARGLSVIVTKNDSVLYDFSPAADITDAVLAELLASRTPAPAR